MAKKQRLLFKPTPISRLSKYRSPIKMVGDPAWNWVAGGEKSWRSREKIVYAYEMDRKGWPMAWKPEVWEAAWIDNGRIDWLLRELHANFDFIHAQAEEENYHFDWEIAERDNAAYHCRPKERSGQHLP